MEIENNRRGRLRIGLDSDHRSQGRSDPNRFAETGYDARHDFHALDVARWDQSERANKARAFARWKYAHPAEYQEMNNLHGNAEKWFHESGGKISRKDETPEETALTWLLAFFSGLLWMVVASIPTMFGVIWLPTMMHPEEPHWIFMAIAVVTGFAAVGGALMALFGLVMTLIYAPFALVMLVFRAFAYPFRTQEQKQKDRQKREEANRRKLENRAYKRRRKAIRREQILSVGRRVQNLFTRRSSVPS